jgi:L-rhamnose-H+ transport protein
LIPNPVIGILLHAIGGVAAASFYAPLKKVRGWSWETFWLVMGISAWLLAPWSIALLTTHNLFTVLAKTSVHDGGLCVIFGMLWGLGNLTFGLSVRYLGMALGFSISLGFCMVFGTLMPPLFDGTLAVVLSTRSGQFIFAGVLVCLGGIAVCGLAGISRERELRQRASSDQKEETTFLPARGFLVATMAGILSACFAFGLASGKSIAKLSIDEGTRDIFANNAVLVVVLTGGLLSNAIWCLALNFKNRSFDDYVTGNPRQQFSNYGLAILGGLIWYGQFFFYGMGTSKLGEQYEFSSWSIHMAFIILFSNLWGIVFREWHGTSARTKALVWAGIFTLVVCTITIGYGNYLTN